MAVAGQGEGVDAEAPLLGGPTDQRVHDQLPHRHLAGALQGEQVRDHAEARPVGQLLDAHDPVADGRTVDGPRHHVGGRVLEVRSERVDGRDRAGLLAAPHLAAAEGGELLDGRGGQDVEGREVRFRGRPGADLHRYGCDSCWTRFKIVLRPRVADS